VSRFSFKAETTATFILRRIVLEIMIQKRTQDRLAQYSEASLLNFRAPSALRLRSPGRDARGSAPGKPVDGVVVVSLA